MNTVVPVIRSSHLGEIEWEDGSELFLPGGLPGFEEERRMIPVEIPAQRPLVFLQSVERPDVCFVSLPVRTIFPEYQLHLSEDDKAGLLIDAAHEPEIGSDVLCLSLLLPGEGTVHANLNAPIVINLHNSRCLQSISQAVQDGHYRLGESGRWEAVCS